MWSTTRCFLDIPETRRGGRLGSTPFAGEPPGNGNRVINVQLVFSERRSRHDVVIVGAGPGGLAVARELEHRHRISALVVDKASAPAMSCGNRYDNFRLNTNGYLSHLPGQRIPLSAGRWPTKEDMVRYFDSYVRQQNIRLALGSEVNRIERAADGWRVDTSPGDIRSAAVVLAPGRARTPVLPPGSYRPPATRPWAGLSQFVGEVVRSVDSGNACPFRDRNILVVGAGN